MTELRLYTRPDCHLCDLASDLLRQEAASLPVQPVNIEDDVALLRRYGVRVPVLHDPESGAELGWPFDAAELRGFLAARRNRAKPG